MTEHDPSAIEPGESQGPRRRSPGELPGSVDEAGAADIPITSAPALALAPEP